MVSRNCAICGNSFVVHTKRIEAARYCSLNCRDIARSLPLETRFWRRVDRRGPDECWNWTPIPKGEWYGDLNIAGRGSGKIRAHVLSYQIHKGEAPKGMVVRHTCDKKPCCNPNHLVLGTQADNVADMMSRNQRQRARTFPKSVVAEIRRAVTIPGATLKKTAETYGCSITFARNVRLGLRRTDPNSGATP